MGEPSLPTSVLHDLRVLVSSIQTHAKGNPRQTDSDLGALHNEVDLLAEVLRVLIDLSSDSPADDLKQVDLRAVIWVARSRVEEVFIDSMQMPRRAKVRIGPLLDLLDLALAWGCEATGRVWLSIEADCSLSIRPARSGSDLAACRPDLETEQAIASLAQVALFESKIDSANRRATFSPSTFLLVD